MTFKGTSSSINSIKRYLKCSSESSALWKIQWKSICSSTEIDLSSWIDDEPRIGPFRAIFAGKQLDGFGQNGRVWHSSLGGVWLSAAMPFPCVKSRPELMGLAIALSLSKRLESMNVPVKIKWPNDLIVYNRKLAGFLPRIISRGKEIRFARIGLGLNVVNKVPKEGIALKEIITTSDESLDFWSAETLLSLENAMRLMPSPSKICDQVENRLWSKEYIEPNSGDIYNIKGLALDGSLIINKGNYSKKLIRW
tara:strand:- start:1592 stop:2347 length:756 start_codon:yes stop_codon:yes gene_type:complete